MKIRKGFVSNSSSSSFIVINKEEPVVFLEGYRDQTFNIGELGETEFGWEETRYKNVYDKINFAWLQASYIRKKHPEYMKMLKEIIKEYTNCSLIFSLITENYPPLDLIWGYIDHQSSSLEGKNLEIFESKENLAKFLFNKNSFIEGDNDNHD